MYLFRRLLNPEIYQGMKQKKHYFEGWYFKCVNESTNHVIAVIPGISRGASMQDSHAFVQVIDGSRGRSDYFPYPIEDFKYSLHDMSFSIGKNVFSKEGFTLSLKNKNMTCSGTLKFLRPVPYPKSLVHPGIMGPFCFIPFMECYHGVVHMEHTLAGYLTIDGKPCNFTQGKGYIEKDWGTSFPNTWVWVQCNHFNEPHTSFMLSYAHIPFLWGSFSGLIAFLNHQGRFYPLTTYQGARVTSLDYHSDTLSLLAESKHHALNLTVKIHDGNQLMAPKKGTMSVPLAESLTSQLDMFLLDKSGRILFEGEGKIVGVEVVGDLSELQ